MMTKTRKLNNNEIDSDKNKALEEGIIEWTKFYRENPHRFCIDYFGLNLYLVQIILIYMFDKCNYAMLICARGFAKSWIAAVYACCRAVLYPNSKIGIAAFTKSQAELIIREKIEKELVKQSPMLAREIKKIEYNNKFSKVTFHNGSTIEAIVSNEQSRGFRFNILIVDEFRLVKKEIQDRILKPFLNVSRNLKFKKDGKYEDYPPEPNKELYLSSAWFRMHEAYDKFKLYVKDMVDGRDKFVLNCNYKLSLHHGILDKERADEMKREMDAVSWIMEMESLFFGENEDAIFKSSYVNPCRTLKNPFYPPTDLEILSAKNGKVKCNLQKRKGELRIISADIAVAEGDNNDNSVYTCWRLLPEKDYYERMVVHIESHNGMKPDKQAIRLKQLFFDFEADFLVIDTQGVGQSVLSDLLRVNYDDARNKEYNAFSHANTNHLHNNFITKENYPVIFEIKAYGQINHDCIIGLLDVFLKNRIKLPINDVEANDMLNSTSGYAKKNYTDQARMILPYKQTTLLVNELINLETVKNDGQKWLKVKEKGKARKDRYSSLAYGNYLANLLDGELKKRNSKNSGQIISFWSGGGNHNRTQRR
ncbi:terminase large subunit domain-containing protein [Clostridioides difficile]|nr:hypothetical protein [Clostridioides difficile]